MMKKHVKSLLLLAITVLLFFGACVIEEDSAEAAVVTVSTAKKTGWIQTGGKWYFYDSTGKMITGWRQISGKWYFFNSQGIMQKGWKQLSGKWYYLDSTGKMITGWRQISGKWYFFNSQGIMQKGWKQLSGKWYYFNSNGVMLTGQKKIYGKSYIFNSNGVWIGDDPNVYFKPFLDEFKTSIQSAYKSSDPNAKCEKLFTHWGLNFEFSITGASFYYSFFDLNNDGLKEMILYQYEPEDGYKFIAGIFAMVNASPRAVMTWSFFGGIIIDKKGYIHQEYEDIMRAYLVQQFNGEEVVVADSVFTDLDYNDNTVYYQSKKYAWDYSGNYSKITKSTFDNVINKWKSQLKTSGELNEQKKFLLIAQ